MEKNLKRIVFNVIYCTVFFLPIVLASPAHSQSFEWVKLLRTCALSFYWRTGTGAAVDTSGNIYVTGYTCCDLGGETIAGEDDVFLAKYDSSGTMKWVKLLGTSLYDHGTGVAVDTSGNIYVTGWTYGDLGGETNAGGNDTFLAKYDSSGTIQWVKLLGSASDDEANGVVVDTSGNIYVTGYTAGDLAGETNAGGLDAFLARYDDSGTMKWVKLLGSSSYDYGTGVAVDTSGNIYVTGYTGGDLGGKNAGEDDVFLAKYDSSGTMKWAKQLGSASDDEANGVAVDTSGNIYVTGYTAGELAGETNAGNYDAFLARYDSSGTMKWVKLLGTAAEDEANGVAVDTSGNVYVTGYTEGNLNNETNAGEDDAFLARYDSSGTMQWVKLLGTSSYDFGNGVAVDTSGNINNIYVTGYTEGDLGGETNYIAYGFYAFLAKYYKDESFPWEIFYPAFIKKK